MYAVIMHSYTSSSVVRMRISFSVVDSMVCLVLNNFLIYYTSKYIISNKRLNVQYCQNISNEQKLFNVGYIREFKKFADCHTFFTARLFLFGDYNI